MHLDSEMLGFYVALGSVVQLSQSASKFGCTAVHARMINGMCQDLERSEVTPCVLDRTAQIPKYPG